MKWFLIYVIVCWAVVGWKIYQIMSLGNENSSGSAFRAWFYEMKERIGNAGMKKWALIMVLVFAAGALIIAPVFVYSDIKRLFKRLF